MKKRFSLKEYDPHCKSCPRLAGFLTEVQDRFPRYKCKPVPPFGVTRPELLIVGLAPGLHGANATGRPFTGDHAGIMLFKTLHKFGFSSHSESLPGDNLALFKCRITNAVKCLPPQNKPVASEVNTCRRFLKSELSALPTGAVVIALGKISHDSIVRAFELSVAKLSFGHGTEYELPGGRKILSSYHCSRYNTQTGRLDQKMFEEIFKRAKALIS